MSARVAAQIACYVNPTDISQSVGLHIAWECLWSLVAQRLNVKLSIASIRLLLWRFVQLKRTAKYLLYGCHNNAESIVHTSLQRLLRMCLSRRQLGRPR